MRLENVRNKKKVRKAQAKMSSTRSSQYQGQNGHFTFISWHPAVPHQHRDTFGPKNRVEGPYWPFWKFEGELNPLWKVWGPFWLFCHKKISVQKINHACTYAHVYPYGRTRITTACVLFRMGPVSTVLGTTEGDEGMESAARCWLDACVDADR